MALPAGGGATGPCPAIEEEAAEAPQPATAWTPEEGAEVEESDYEEPEELKRVVACRAPTQAEKEEHALQNHAVYRDWCSVCVAARGLGTPHRRRKKDAAGEQEGPRIFSDYFYMSTDEKSMPMLALKFSRSGRVAATALESKGLTEFGVKFFAGFIRQTGVKRFLNCSVAKMP